MKNKTTKKSPVKKQKKRKKVNFGKVKNKPKKIPKSPHVKRGDTLKINLPFEEAIKILSSPKPRKNS